MNDENMWIILYNLIYEEWIDGLTIFIEYGGNINTKSNDEYFNFSNMNIPLFTIGNQNGLFVTNNEKIIKFLYDNKIEEIIDNNFNTHVEYKKNRNNFNFMKNNYYKVKERCNKLKNCTRLNNLELIENNKDNEIYKKYKLNEDLKNFIKLDDIINHNVEKVNSMHNKSISININENILNIIYTITNNKFYVSKIVGFYLKYDCVTDDSLDIHIDDSKITIILCLENTSDCKIIFNETKTECLQEKNCVYIHSGTIPHYVTKQNYGIKENIVLWLS
jgi:hypothetical protein